jgi:hypothetical protein
MNEAQFTIIYATANGVIIDCDGSNFRCGTHDITMDIGDTAVFINVQGSTEDVVLLSWHDESKNLNYDDDTPEAADGDFADAAALEGDGSLSADTVSETEIDACEGEGTSVLEFDNSGNPTCKDSVQTTIAAPANGDAMRWDSGNDDWRNRPVRDECNITFESATTADDIMCGKATGALTIVQLDCTPTGAADPEAHLVTVVECGAGGGSCTSVGLTAQAETVGENYSDSNFSGGTGAAIADGNWWGIETTSLTTAATFLHCQVEFTRDD